MSKEKQRVKMLLVILTESDGEGVVPGGQLCSGWWSELHWAGSGWRSREPAAAAQTVPLPLPPQSLRQCGHLQVGTMGR